MGGVDVGWKGCTASFADPDMEKETNDMIYIYILYMMFETSDTSNPSQLS